MPRVLVTGPTVTQNSPFSSLAIAVTIASTHYAYPQRDDQAELAWVAWLNSEMVYPQMVTHFSTNPAQLRVTSLMCIMTLPWSPYVHEILQIICRHVYGKGYQIYLRKHLWQICTYYLNLQNTTISSTVWHLKPFLQRVSIACYAKRCISYRKSVRPSDRLSHAGIKPKRLKLRSRGLHCRIAPWL